MDERLCKLGHVGSRRGDYEMDANLICYWENWLTIKLKIFHKEGSARMGASNYKVGTFRWEVPVTSFPYIPPNQLQHKVLLIPDWAQRACLT